MSICDARLGRMDHDTALIGGFIFHDDDDDDDGGENTDARHCKQTVLASGSTV